MASVRSRPPGPPAVPGVLFSDTTKQVISMESLHSVFSKMKQNCVQSSYFLVLMFSFKVSPAKLHVSPYTPRLSIGPYHPWPWEGTNPTQQYRMQSRLPLHHQGYQTNIIINPSSKVIIYCQDILKHDDTDDIPLQTVPVVKIVTSDLETGLVIKRTEWSGRESIHHCNL